MIIHSWIRINERLATTNIDHVLSLYKQLSGNAPDDFYRALDAAYPKFFKMDALSKWGWIGAESLLQAYKSSLQHHIDLNRVAVAIGTAHGCLDTDKKYYRTTADIPSPALFVYTLPNIVLGEISIRHGFKGEQACFISDVFDPAQLVFYVTDLLQHRDMDACLCGWLDVNDGKPDICMFWVQKAGEGLQFTPTVIQSIYNV